MYHDSRLGLEVTKVTLKVEEDIAYFEFFQGNNTKPMHHVTCYAPEFNATELFKGKLERFETIVLIDNTGE